MNRIRVKICCISSLDEAAMAIDAGADALGLVGEMPSGPGVIEDGLVRTIAEFVPPPVSTVLLTARRSADAIADHVSDCGTSAVQIVRHVDPSEYPALIKSLPSVKRIQVIHVEDETALELLERYEPYVHAFLLDSGRPAAARVELGGTGRTHNWEISAEFVRRSQKPVFLAGGLRPGNVAEAIERVSPFGVDLCSGVRTLRKLDPVKLERFMNAVRSAWRDDLHAPTS